MDSFRATYRIQTGPAGIDERVEALLLEQTVELPRAAVRDPFVEKEILGRVDKISPEQSGGFSVSITFPVATTALDPAHFLSSASAWPGRAKVSFTILGLLPEQAIHRTGACSRGYLEVAAFDRCDRWPDRDRQ